VGGPFPKFNTREGGQQRKKRVRREGSRKTKSSTLQKGVTCSSGKLRGKGGLGGTCRGGRLKGVKRRRGVSSTPRKRNQKKCKVRAIPGQKGEGGDGKASGGDQKSIRGKGEVEVSFKKGRNVKNRGVVRAWRQVPFREKGTDER